DGGGNDGRQLYGFLAQFQDVSGNTVDVQQIVDEPGHVLGLSFDYADGPAQLRRLWTLGIQNLQCVTNRSQRIAQLVCERGEEFVFTAIRLDQRFFQTLAARQIYTNAENARRQIGDVLDHTPAVGNPDDVSIRAYYPILGLKVSRCHRVPKRRVERGH